MHVHRLRCRHSLESAPHIGDHERCCAWRLADPRGMFRGARGPSMKIQDTLGRAQQIAQQARQVAETVADAVRGAGGLEGPRLETVRYAFRVPNGPDPDWHVRRVKIT